MLLSLNSEQAKAVHHKTGPLLIIAGAGTGKTTVITERVKFLIEKSLAQPSEILALTFTEKAAREMESRVDLALPLGFTQLWISTFHSFCEQVLRSDALNIGLDPDFNLLGQASAIQFLRDNIFELDLDYFRPLGNPTKFVAGALQHFSRLADEDISPKEYLEWVKKQKAGGAAKEDYQKWQELSFAYRKYDELKIKKGLMDFSDLITNTLKLFRGRVNVLAEYRNKYKYILVDEYQDTNIAQNELVKLLAGKKQNITAVLDDDQSIYRFRGASFSNALQFRKSFPKTKVISLTKNYRSGQEILDGAYKLIQFNNPDRLEIVEKIAKKLTFQGTKIGEVSFIHTDRVENEAFEVAKQIQELLGEGFAASDIAILVRANNHAEPFTRALQRSGIPFQFLGPGKLFKEREVVDLIAYLKVLANPDDSESFYRLLLADFLDLDALDLSRITNFAKAKNKSIYDVCKTPQKLPIKKKTKTKLAKLLVNFRKHLNATAKESAGQILYNFLSDNDLLATFVNPDDANAERKAKNIAKFFDKLKSYETTQENPNVVNVVSWLDLARELGESPLASDSDWTEVDAVNLLTIHSSKGLEFPIVFLVNLVAQRFPSMNRADQIPIPEKLIKEVLPVGDSHLQEERRLFYVGMTRAKEKLFLTASDYYGEGKRTKKLSPFIFETLGEKVTANEIRSAVQQSFLDFKTMDTPHFGKVMPLHIDYLSFSQIETFRICPLHYKLNYVLKIPTPQTSAQSFGNSFHKTMKAFYDEVAAGRRPTEKLIHGLLQKSWINEGYTGKTHEEKSFTKAKSFLTHYLENMFDRKTIPIATEQPFLVHLVQGKESLRVGGKIDRIDEHNNQIEIIDYKTGSSVISQKEADTSLQLSIYALAATTITEPPFNRKPDEIKLSLYYFDTPTVVTTYRTAKQLQEAEKELFLFKKQIEKSDFACSEGIICQNCEYKMFCDA